MILTRLSGLALATALLASPAADVSTKVLCEGFLPPNDMKIPVTAFQVGGISPTEFNAVMDKIEAYYAPIVQAKGATLRLNRLWNDDTVNASAQQQGRTWILNMYGGLARHPVMNADGMMMVACHEMGHHIGGAPKIDGWFGTGWASNEGESDYFSSLRCMRKMFTDEENAKFVETQEIDPVAKQKCEEAYTTQAEENLCMREAMAGMVGAKIFQALRKETTAPRFDTPDPAVVTRMDDDHPATQCRLDTYFQGALCFHDQSVELSNSDPNVGTCTIANGQNDGLRPRCWFKP